ncbi:MAG TPA: TetR/AcrR family transcriptional regulator [Acidimicrobiia bacterium]|nr:TetR/AcrR family transcriptional regulator [Acidimicrobiia bacterium]
MEARDQLLATTLHLLAERGYAALGLRDVAAEVGVTTGSIYHHFDSKEDLVRSAVEHYASRVLDEQRAMLRSDASATARLWSVVDWLVPEADPGWQRDFSLVLNVELRKLPGFEDLYARFRRSFFRLVREPIRDGIATGELSLPEGASIEDVVALVIAGVVGILQMQAHGAVRVPVDRLLRLHMATVLGSLRRA